MTRSVEIPDAAVEAGTLAALKNYGPTWDANTESLIRADVRAALVAARPYLMPTREVLEELVGQAWDDGNAMGLDGYVGPNRGAGDVDHEAERGRERMVGRLLALLNGGAS